MKGMENLIHEYQETIAQYSTKLTIQNRKSEQLRERNERLEVKLNSKDKEWRNSMD